MLYVKLFFVFKYHCVHVGRFDNANNFRNVTVARGYEVKSLECLTEK